MAFGGEGSSLPDQPPESSPPPPPPPPPPGPAPPPPLSAKPPMHCGYIIHTAASARMGQGQAGSLEQQLQGQGLVLGEGAGSVSVGMGVRVSTLVPEVRSAASELPSPLLLGGLDQTSLERLVMQLSHHSVRWVRKEKCPKQFMTQAVCCLGSRWCGDVLVIVAAAFVL